MRPKACKSCGEKFIPERQMQVTCGIPCAIDYSRKQRAKAERVAALEDRKTIRIKIEKLKPLSYWADKAQVAVNAYIRARDEGQPCISCGRHHQGKVNAGHYRSRGAMPALRYHHDNIHLQCEPCNSSKAGNQLEYRIRLIQKIGIERVEWLEGPHESPRWKKEDYQRIEAEHKDLLRELKK
jgi:hypothetical protein